MITTGKSRPFVAPNPTPILALVVGISPEAKAVFSHLPGIEKGSLIYSDINAYGWYSGKLGYVTTNRGRKGMRRTRRGYEDGLGTTRT